MEALIRGLLWFFGLAITLPIWVPVLIFVLFASLFEA